MIPRLSDAAYRNVFVSKNNEVRLNSLHFIFAQKHELGICEEENVLRHISIRGAPEVFNLSIKDIRTGREPANTAVWMCFTELKPYKGFPGTSWFINCSFPPFPASIILQHNTQLHYVQIVESYFKSLQSRRGAKIGIIKLFHCNIIKFKSLY